MKLKQRQVLKAYIDAKIKLSLIDLDLLVDKKLVPQVPNVFSQIGGEKW